LVAIKAVRLNMNIPIDLSSPASLIKYDEIIVVLEPEIYDSRMQGERVILKNSDKIS
jgi:hypothetical protein